MLSTKYGPEIKTWYSGSPLDRVSYLREDAQFIEGCLVHPEAKFVVLKGLSPLLEGKNFSLQKKSSIEELLKTATPVFLGLAPPKEGTEIDIHRGLFQPYFSIDATGSDLELSGEYPKDARFAKLNADDAAIYAEARQVTDWINRNKFCAQCGSKTQPTHGGFKLACENDQCPSKSTLSNICFPRTDSSIIVAVLDYAGENILLGRGKRFPGNMYSCLAGFLEPGESLEDCVRREVFEESGVKVGRVMLHSSQPWPFPANIMVGCIAQIVDESPESHKINLGHDPELADAQWVPVAKVRKLCDSAKNREMGGDMFLPPPEAIAWVLLDRASDMTKSKF